MVVQAREGEAKRSTFARAITIGSLNDRPVQTVVQKPLISGYPAGFNMYRSVEF
jgi:hypothetical protein